MVLKFLDTAWGTPGAFVGAVDLARSWKRGTLRDGVAVPVSIYNRRVIETSLSDLTNRR